MGHSFSLSVRPNVHGFIQAALRPANGQRHTRVVKRHLRRIKRTHAAETRSVHHMVDRRTHPVRTDSDWATRPALRTSGNVRSMRPYISSRCADEDCSSPMGHARPAPLNTHPPPACPLIVAHEAKPRSNGVPRNGSSGNTRAGGVCSARSLPRSASLTLPRPQFRRSPEAPEMTLAMYCPRPNAPPAASQISTSKPPVRGSSPSFAIDQRVVRNGSARSFAMTPGLKLRRRAPVAVDRTNDSTLTVSKAVCHLQNVST